ncbi:DUF5682 family protein [Terrimonas sp. NA20]|uniref:DUF5682 family protein n=1 Tax=Terrimonas ginsenosidimutans TaxID=2908004 RepID=A0ABS9KN72_9BACT|nr:DUF5682 family protein [Terrimonas ginsenosidimutans]MCG2613772.1 DUF5682 family protein [Terrimonas ginsenosidimutans]
MAIHILGIRHHGPGSARNVKAFLEANKPDIVLVEGPPEADEILSMATDTELKPPVAILCYQPDAPQHSSFYPFADFSPEWQAILYAKRNNIHVRFMDLPVCNLFPLRRPNPEEPSQDLSGKGSDTVNNVSEETTTEEEEQGITIQIKKDPVTYLAEAAGYDDGEKWWEHMFEHRIGNEEVFEAINEAMGTLRELLPEKEDRIEQAREAHMRKMIRQAEREMFQNIVVICGAWHAPALINMPSQKQDNDILKGLSKVKIDCTWIPWTYNRLSYTSGYGAGVFSPGWYEHVWQHPEDDGTLWMAKVAKLFRQKQMDTSVAHVIEAVRLAESLASLRQLPKAGLDELNEATLSVLCNGESILLSLVNRELVISDRLGQVPDTIPKPPLQVDIEKTQKRLRLPATADWKDYTLDLRKENDLERSILLHRLRLLNINWGQASASSGKGTFKEQWRLQWQPEFSIEIIEKGTYGNTTEEAAATFVEEQSAQATSLKVVCSLLEESIPAELPKAVEALIKQINTLAAASGDVIQLMEVVPGLVSVTRYGNVRKTDAELVSGIATSMITRICISLPAACTGIDDESATNLVGLLATLNDSVSLLQNEEVSRQWQQTLTTVAENNNTAAIIAGYATRLLADYKILEGEALVKAFYYAMSTASVPAAAAAWLEGFLKGSGTLLLLDNDIWNIVHQWIGQLEEESFTQVLPLLRRSVAEFTPAERRKLGEKAKTGNVTTIRARETDIDEERAMKGIPVILQLLGHNNN